MTADRAALLASARSQIGTSAALHQELAEHAPLLLDIAQLWAQAMRTGHLVMFCGNGGSAADAEHLAGELVGAHTPGERFTRRAMALSASAAVMTALANDRSYDAVFETQVSTFGSRGDVLVALSTSGNSRNVLAAVARASEMGMRTVALTGSSGQLRDTVELALCVRSTVTPRVQECYMTAGHVICSLVESILAMPDG